MKLRLWLACLSGGLVASAGVLWLLATPSLSPADPAVYGWLAGIALASLVLGLLLALWIDHHVVGHLHGLLLGLRSNRVAELRGLPAGAGWGELSELGDAVQEVLERRQREMRVRLAGIDDDRHAGAACDRQHRGILGETMHVEAHRAAITCMLAGARDERSADPMAAMRRQHGNAELGGVVEEPDMRGADDREAVVVDGEHRVALEVDPLDIRSDCRRRKGRAKTQTDVLRG